MQVCEYCQSEFEESRAPVFFCDCQNRICPSCCLELLAFQRETFFKGTNCPRCFKLSQNISGVEACQEEVCRLVGQAFKYFEIARHTDYLHLIRCYHQMGIVETNIDFIRGSDSNESILQLELARLEYKRSHCIAGSSLFPLTLLNLHTKASLQSQTSQGSQENPPALFEANREMHDWIMTSEWLDSIHIISLICSYRCRVGNPLFILSPTVWKCVCGSADGEMIQCANEDRCVGSRFYHQNCVVLNKTGNSLNEPMSHRFKDSWTCNECQIRLSFCDDFTGSTNIVLNQLFFRTNPNSKDYYLSLLVNADKDYSTFVINIPHTEIRFATLFQSLGEGNFVVSRIGLHKYFCVSLPQDPTIVVHRYSFKRSRDIYWMQFQNFISPKDKPKSAQSWISFAQELKEAKKRLQLIRRTNHLVCLESISDF